MQRLLTTLFHAYLIETVLTMVITLAVPEIKGCWVNTLTVQLVLALVLAGWERENIWQEVPYLRGRETDLKVHQCVLVQILRYVTVLQRVLPVSAPSNAARCCNEADSRQNLTGY